MKKAQGTVQYEFVSAKKGKKSFNGSFKVKKDTGRITVKKGLKRGKYSVTVKVYDPGNKNYKSSGWKKVTFILKVK